MLRLASVTLAGVFLAACASDGGYGYGHGPYGRDYREPVPPVRVGPDTSSPANPLARSMNFTCEDLTTVTLTEGRPAQVTFNSGLVVTLDYTGGNRYGIGQSQFIVRGGGEGTFYNKERAVRCRAK
jgi:hypothetical protein